MDINSKKNVLVIAYYFPPMGLSGVQRTLKFVKYLPLFGWNPIVLTTEPGGYYAYDSNLLNELSEDVAIYRTPTKDVTKFFKNKDGKTMKFPSYFRHKITSAILQTFMQPDSRRSWKKAAIKKAEEILQNNKIDVIFSTAPPYTDFLVANELSKKYNIPYVVDYRDLWTDNPYNFYATPLHKNYAIRMEEDVLTFAERAIVITRTAKEDLIKRFSFLSHEDISIIPHGFDPDDFANVGEINKDRSKFVITHSGAFQDSRTPKYFFKAVAALLKTHPDLARCIELRFVGLMRPSHAKIAKKLGLEPFMNNIGYVEHKEAVRNLLESDLLWLTLNDKERTPGKLYEYFGAQKPILICSPEGAMRRLALESKVAIATEPKDSESMTAALEKFYSMWKSNMLPKPDKAFIAKYNRKSLTSELARELSIAADTTA